MLLILPYGQFGGLRDLSGGQLFMFRSGTVNASNDLNEAEWLNDNLSPLIAGGYGGAVNEAWVIWDYGPDSTSLTNSVELLASNITEGAQVLNAVIDLGTEERNNVQIPVAQTNTAFNTAITNLISSQQVWFPLPGVAPIDLCKVSVYYSYSYDC